MPKETRTKDAWRKYLRREYKKKISSRFENKMRSETRQRAEKYMTDLLLIIQKSKERDKTLIFKNPKTRKNLVNPLVRELMNTSQCNDKEVGKAIGLGEDLQRMGINYSWSLILRSKSYREKKHTEVLCKEGFPREYARKIATGEAQKRYPHARTVKPLDSEEEYEQT